MKKFQYYVVYLAYEPYKIDNFKKFINNYKYLYSGQKHQLVICFKKFSSKKSILEWKKLLKGIKYTAIIDNCKIDDFDFGSYIRVAGKYKNKIILFLNSHSYPIKNNWLKLIAKHYTKKSLVGCTASYASLSSSFFSYPKYYRMNFLKCLIYGFFNLFRFPIFPNPHIRSNAFLIKGSDFLSLKLPIFFQHKLQTNMSESGWFGMTRQLKKKKFRIILANSKGEGYLEPAWIKSETFSYKDQDNLIISDNRTRIYKNSSLKNKKKEQKFHWGI
jgi:hypothetical protein